MRRIPAAAGVSQQGVRRILAQRIDAAGRAKEAISLVAQGEYATARDRDQAASRLPIAATIPALSSPAEASSNAGSP
jgi:hypothetical protein